MLDLLWRRHPSQGLPRVCARNARWHGQPNDSYGHECRTLLGWVPHAALGFFAAAAFSAAISTLPTGTDIPAGVPGQCATTPAPAARFAAASPASVGAASVATSVATAAQRARGPRGDGGRRRPRAGASRCPRACARAPYVLLTRGVCWAV